jgi:hypothetical protein
VSLVFFFLLFFKLGLFFFLFLPLPVASAALTCNPSHSTRHCEAAGLKLEAMLIEAELSAQAKAAGATVEPHMHEAHTI